jgi:hypothetical protein
VVLLGPIGACVVPSSEWLSGTHGVTTAPGDA